MAFLVRDVLEAAADLDAAVAIFRDNPRRCEYYILWTSCPVAVTMIQSR